MFSGGPNFTKLKTNLRLAINRLKLLEKKKMELTQKSRKEIADYIGSGKIERAKIRVEHIIREDYLVEAMEMLEMFCDLLLARFGLLQQMKAVDPGLAEAISSIIWAGPRLVSDVPELKCICEQLTLKYGKEYAESCRDESKSTVSEKLKHRLGVQAPSKLLTEKYLIEISKNFDVEYKPDTRVMKEAEVEDLLHFDNDNKNNLGGGGGGANVLDPPGFKGYPHPPMPSDFQPFNYNFSSDPTTSSTSKAGGFVVPQSSDGSPSSNVNPGFGVPFSYNIPPTADEDVGKKLNYPMAFETPPPSYSNFEKDTTDAPVDKNQQYSVKPKPTPRSKISPPGGAKAKTTADLLFPELPEVPKDVPTLSNEDFLANSNKNENLDEIDFDDLTRRFENLKKKK